MKEDLLISVIIPVHNTASYLYKCVESVRNQSLKEIEIILVDNLSTDGSSEICDEYAKIDSRIKVLHLSIADLSTARNAGVDVASSPYIGFIDSDDYIHPSMYEEMLHALINNKADLVYCNFFLDSVSKLESPYPNSGNTYVRSCREVLQDMMWERTTCSACNKLFKKEFFTTLRFPEGKLYEDRLVMHHWLLNCQQIVWVDKAFYYYVSRESSICHTIIPLNRYHYFLAEFSRLDFIKQNDLFDKEESVEVNSQIINNCYSIFCQIMQLTKPKYFREPIEEMKAKLRSLSVHTKNEIDKKSYKRIRKITYFWPIYSFFHFSFRSEKWKP